jgi:hypothetical protein
MTLADNYTPIRYTGNGLTTNFPFTFTVFEEEHLQIFIQNINTNAMTLLGSGSYVVSGLPDNGNIFYAPSGVPLPPTFYLIISRLVPNTQDLEITNQSGFFPETLMKQLDLLEMQIQQVDNGIERSLKRALASPPIPPGHIAKMDPSGGDFVVDGGIPTFSLEEVELVQQFIDDVQRCIKLPIGDIPPDLPAAIIRQSRVLGFDAFGVPVVADVEMRVTGNQIEFRIGTGAWRLTGLNTDDLTGGTVELRESGGVVQWKRVNEVVWVDLFTVNSHTHDDAYRRGYVTDLAVTEGYVPGEKNYLIDRNGKAFGAVRNNGKWEIARDIDAPTAPMEWTIKGPSANPAEMHLKLVDASNRLFGEISLKDGTLTMPLDQGMVGRAVSGIFDKGIAPVSISDAFGNGALSFDVTGKPITAARKLSGQTFVTGSTVYLRRSSGQVVALGTFVPAIVAHQAIDDERAVIWLDLPQARSQTGYIYDIYGNTPILSGSVSMMNLAYGQSGAAGHQANQAPLTQPSVFPDATQMMRTTRAIQDCRGGLNSTSNADELSLSEISGLTPLVEKQGYYIEAGQTAGTAISDVIQSAASKVANYPLSMAFLAHGVGSQPLSAIGDNTALGNTVETTVNKMKQLYDDRGHDAFINILLDHGEAANGSEYFGQLQTLRTWLPPTLQGLTAQARTPLIGHAPNCSYTGSGMIFAASQAMKFLRWSQTQNPHNFRIFSTQYQYFARAAGLQSCTVDLVHKNKLGQLKLGQMYAHMLIDEVLLGKTWKYPYIDQVTHAGQVVTIRFADLDGALEDYTIANGARSAEWLANFANSNIFIRSSAANLPVTNVALISANEIQVTVTGAFTATNNQVRFGNATHAVGNLLTSTVPTINFADNGWSRDCLYEPGTKLRKALAPVLVLFNQNAVTPITFTQHYGS